MYIDRLDEIVDNCNKTYRIIKMKPDDVQPSIYILSMVLSIMTKILNSKLVTMLEDQNTEIFLQRATP